MLQRAVAKARHVEQILDIAVQPLAFLADVLGQITPCVRGKIGIYKMSSRTDDGHQRRAQVVADAVQQSRAQPVGFGRKLGCRKVLGQPQPFQCQGDLVDQRIQQPPVGAQKLAVVGVGDAKHPQPPVAEAYLKGLMHDCTRLAEEPLAVRTAAARVQARCETLYTYLANNMESLVDYGRRYLSGLPISSSRAEGSVDDIANARMGKRRRMRWSPKGAHRVAVTKAAVLDGRLTVANRKRAA